MTAFTDVAVIGAGAAGIAASRCLAAAGVDHLLLEARDRAGGRAWTVEAAGYPVDMGAEWLHSADVNPLVRVLEPAGWTIDRSPPPWGRASGGQGYSAAERARFGEALGELEDRISAQAATGVDRPVAELMSPDGPWNGMLNAFSSAYNGAPFRDISCLDYDAYVDTGVNWRVREGYGAGLASLAPAGLRAGVTVSRIDRSGAALRLVTSQGDLSARAAVIAVPPTLLARGVLAITPELPDKLQAAHDLPLGLADKLFLKLKTPEAFPVDGHMFGRPGRANTGGFHLRPLGRPLIELFIGGDEAWTLEAEWAGALEAFALEELTHLVGRDITRDVAPLVSHPWGADPWALGSYSYARPGRRTARALLAAPVEDRLFFAGEATSPDFFSTVHGAWMTGEQAAAEAMASLRGGAS